MKKIILTSVVAVLISFFFATLTQVSVANSFANTVFTVSGIMFSIGMGVVCTFNPAVVKNATYLQTIRADTLKVRNSYIAFFALTSFVFAADQLFPEYRPSFTIKSVELAFSLPLLSIAVNSISTVYYILNFLEIQRLSFDITDRANKV